MFRGNYPNVLSPGSARSRARSRHAKQCNKRRFQLEKLEDRVVLSSTTPLDLTMAGAQGTINGAIFTQGEIQPAGSGVLQSFVRVDNSPQEQGYNTDGAFQFDEVGGGFTRSIHVSDIPPVVIGGKLYRQFVLDINQQGSSSLLSLDEVQIFLGNTASPTNYPNAPDFASSNKIYDMDLGPDGDSWVKLDGNTSGAGSGKTDMIMDVPAGLFTGGNQFIYLYSHFGAQNLNKGDTTGSANDGYEEWAFQGGPGLATPTVTTAIHLGAKDSGAPTVVTITTQGTTVHDSATVAGVSGKGTPTGQVSFLLEDPSGKFSDAGTVTLVNGVADPSIPATLTQLGTYHFFAHYLGDNTYAPADGPDEPITVTQATLPTPTVTTSNTPTTGTIGDQTVLYDTATLTAPSGDTDPLDGTVTFTLYAPDSNVAYTSSAIPVSQFGIAYGTNTPSGFQLTQVGTYEWVANYSGGTHYNSSASNLGDEPVTVSPASPSIATHIQVTGDGTVGSTTIGDKATISGGYNVTGGTIHFTLDTPTATGVDEGTVNVTGTGDYYAPTPVLVTLVGTYTWHASYSGDGLNKGAVDDGSNESLTTVKATPKVVTQANPTGIAVLGKATSVSDKVTLSGGYNPADGSATVTIGLYAPGDTTFSNPLYSTQVTVAADFTFANNQYTYTATTTYTFTQAGTYMWHAAYNGNSLNNTASDDGTNESVKVTNGTPLTIGYWGNKNGAADLAANDKANPVGTLTSEVQNVTVTGSGGGKFTLTFNGHTTAALAWNASAATVKTALNGLVSGYGTNPINVTLSSGVYIVTFGGGLSGINVPQMTVTPIGTATASVSTTTQGSLTGTTSNWRVLLNTLSLRDGSGNLFWVPTGGTEAAAVSTFQTWLQSASATNMAYMLSAQLAAMELNVLIKGVNPLGQVYIGAGSPVNTWSNNGQGSNLNSNLNSGAMTYGLVGTTGGLITIADVMSDAISMLTTNGYTVTSGPARLFEESLKIVLDATNNGII